MTQADVLVVGAGPAGLTLACDLARRGVAVRIVDRAPEFARGSRGKGLSPRSLEVLDDLGLIDELLKAGVTHLPHRKYQGAEVIAQTDPESGQVATPEIPYPVGLMIPQWRVEEALRERLAGFGVAVELGAELRDLNQDADGVTATVGDAQIHARYLAGCDGGHSTVRKALGLRLHGETPDVQLMAVGDVEVDGLGRDAWHQWFGADGAIMLCPLPGTTAFQVQASHELGPDGSPLEPTLETFQRTFDRVAGVPGVRLHDLTWRSSYRVNVRMTDRLRVGRVFLAGDAAHVHLAGSSAWSWPGRPLLACSAPTRRNGCRSRAGCSTSPRNGWTPSSPRSRSRAAAWTRWRRPSSPSSRSATGGAGSPVTPRTGPRAGLAGCGRATGRRTPPAATGLPGRRCGCSTCSADRISPCSAWVSVVPRRSAPSTRTSSSPT
jgi:2-polyprenyl-6-methoxyphenol hydroxylase-like FAD-dependent oxidoreductase